MRTARIKKNRSPEKDLQLSIIKYLKMLGATVGKTKMTGIRNKHGQMFFDPYTFRGFPDLAIFYENKMLFVEVKAKGNGQSPEQITFQKLCISAGIKYILAYSLDDVINGMGIKELFNGNT